MKRYMAILGFVFVGVLAGLLVRGIPIRLQVNAGGEIPRGSQNGDVNGDSMLDMSDAVYLLIHLFNGGPEPIACADSDEIWEEVRAIEGEVNGLGGPLASIAESLAYESLKNRPDRFVDNGDGTVTDRHTRLMWPKGMNYQADNARRADRQLVGNLIANVAEMNMGGHTDWRLPTIHELLSLGRFDDWDASFPYEVLEPDNNAYYFSSTLRRNDPSYPWSVQFQSGGSNRVVLANSGYILPVRDIE